MASTTNSRPRQSKSITVTITMTDIEETDVKCEELDQALTWSIPADLRSWLDSMNTWQHKQSSCWLTEGQTVLILKNPQKEAIPSNYQPITCLCTTWKLLSSIIVSRIAGHMVQYMSGAQKEIRRNTREQNIQHWLTEESPKTARPDRPICATAEYNKAYDLMLHTWI